MNSTLTAIPQMKPQSQPDLRDVLDKVVSRIAPSWPLQNFVAVNPFLGLTSESFDAAARRMQRVAAPGMLMPGSWYRQQMVSGRIPASEVVRVARVGQLEPDELLEALSDDAVVEDRVRSFAEMLDLRDGSTLWTHLVTEEIGRWCAAYYDLGQAAWPMPWKDEPLYVAWKQAAQLGMNPEAAGLKHFRKSIQALPEHPIQAIQQMLKSLEIPAVNWRDFLHHLLLTISGWSSHLTYRIRQGLDQPGVVEELLAIRLAYDHALKRAFPEVELEELPVKTKPSRNFVARRLCQNALERAYQTPLLHALAGNQAVSHQTKRNRCAVQAVFCIDVRSEPIRRQLEAQSEQIETLGFAGFFGFPIEQVEPGAELGKACCPVLLKPSHAIALDQDVVRSNRLRHWREVVGSLRQSTSGAFSYVETAGVLQGWKLLSDAFGSAKRRLSRLEPKLRLDAAAGGLHSIPLMERVAMAEGALRGMSLTDGFARLVLLCGHGSESRNNPHASSLDCGACGGHAGGFSARVAASVLNDPEVRRMLVTKGISIPEDTWFLSGIHLTTTDELMLHAVETLPESHRIDIEQLQVWLQAASDESRKVRVKGSGAEPSSADEILAILQKRATDGSEVRPEWGLAGNAALLAAPRSRSRGLNLEGRVFLHSYEASDDPELNILSLILSAPVVVASWINLQYYASTVNPERFGGGNKVLHQVVAGFGVVEGNRGDLRTGLPWQSLHDGSRFVHEPMRLSVVVEDTPERIEEALSRAPVAKELFDHHWLHLFSLEPGGKRVLKRVGDEWREFP